MSKRDKPNYEVGYGKPPKSTRFKKGHSGNLNGRPNEAKNVGSMLQETFFKKIPIVEGGVQKKVTALEAIFRQILRGALQGETRQIDRVFKLLPLLQATLAAAEVSAGSESESNPKADLAVLETMAEIMGGDVQDIFATAQAEVGHDCPEF